MSVNRDQDKASGIKRVIENFGQNTTLHGVQGICKKSSHPAQRIVWLVVLSAGLCLYGVVSFISISNYFKYESITKISTTSVGDLDFPAVTFCDQNTIPISTLQKLDDSGIGLECLEKGLARTLSPDDTFCIEILHSISFYDLIEVGQRALLTDTFQLCSFNQVD